MADPDAQEVESWLRSRAGRVKVHAGNAYTDCPSCERQRSLIVCLTPTKKTSFIGAWNCKGCDARGNWRQLRDLFNDPLPSKQAPQRVVKPLHKLAGRLRVRPTPEPREEPKGPFRWHPGLADECHELLRKPEAELVRNYLRSRGFSPAEAERFQLGAFRIPYRNDREVWFVSIPVCNHSGHVVNVRFRPVDGQQCPWCDDGCKKCRQTGKVRKMYVHCTGRPLPLYGAESLPEDTSTPVIVTEGELDRVAFHAYGYQYVASGTMGAGNFDDEWLDLLEPYEQFYLAYDDDEAGDDGANALAEKLGRHRCSRVRFPRKDIGDCLQEGVPQAEVDQAVADAEPMMDVKFRRPAEWADRIEDLVRAPERLRGRDTGSTKLNQSIAGWRPGVVIVTGDTSAGKCLAEGTLVTQSLTGKRVPIEQIRPFDSVATVTVTGDIVPAIVTRIHFDGERETVEVVLSSGRRICCTRSHRFLTIQQRIYGKKPSGAPMWKRAPRHESLVWRTVDEFNKFTRVAVPSGLPFFGSIEFNDNELKVLGYMIGDGQMGGQLGQGGSSPVFTNGSEAVLEDFFQACDQVGIPYKFAYKGRGRTSWRLPKASFAALLDKYDLQPTKSGKKKVPNCLFGASKRSIVVFLKALMDCDGWLCRHGPRTRERVGAQVGYSSKSYELADGVRHLLLKFGIMCSMSSKTVGIIGTKRIKAGEQTYWSITSARSADVKTYIEQIGFLKYEADKVCSILDNLPRDKARPGQYGGLVFESVSKITETGRRKVYDIEVPVTHCFVAGDIIVHNTSFVTWIADRQSRYDVPILLTSFEDEPIVTVQRLLAIELGKDMLEADEDQRRAALERIDGRPVYLVDHYGMMDGDELIESIRFAARRYGIKFAVVDHMGFLVQPGETEVAELARLIRKFATVAVHDHVTIVIVHHPNRLPQHQQRRVTIRDLKGASAIEQDCHLGLVVRRVKPCDKTGGHCGVTIYNDKCRGNYGVIGSTAFLFYDRSACTYADEWDSLPEARRQQAVDF